jgi:hypothetical protein
MIDVVRGNRMNISRVENPCRGEGMESESREFIGTVINGVVVLEGGSEIPEGTQVRVVAIETAEDKEPLGKRLLKFAGTIPGLPPDMAENHDHYIHGRPKK